MSAHQPISPNSFKQLHEDVIRQLNRNDPDGPSSWETYIYRNMIKELYPLLFMARLEVRRHAGPSDCDNLLALAGIEKALFEMQIPLQKEIKSAEERAEREEIQKQVEQDAQLAERQQGDDE